MMLAKKISRSWEIRVVNRPSITNTLNSLEEVLQGYPDPMSLLLVREFGRQPFIVLMSCLISLRARDTATYPICRQLFRTIQTPQDMLALDKRELEKILHSVGFYRQKAFILHDVCQQLVDRFAGTVPSNLQDLLSLRHVGAKTAALVQSEGFGIPAICVDVHVHRLANALGWVTTHTPEQTQQALYQCVPRDHWTAVNRLLVKLGQQSCPPMSTLCVTCPIILGGLHVGLKRPSLRYLLD
jgi:endonuclease III